MRLGMAYPDQQRWPKWRWVADAAESLGHEVVRIRNAASLPEADQECDAILFSQKGAGLDEAAVIAASPGHQSVWACWTWDLLLMDEQNLADSSLLYHHDPTGKPAPSPMLRMLRAMDLVLVKERDRLGQYAEAGVKAEWEDQGWPPWLASIDYGARLEFDALMAGSSERQRTERRRDVAALVEAGMSVAWASHPCGDGLPPGVVGLPWCPVDELPELASRASAFLSVDFRHDVDGYWSDRLWLGMGMGAAVVRRSSPGLPTAPMLVYRNEGELVEAVRRLKASSHLRQTIGRAARDYARRTATYGCQLRRILDRCSAIRQSKCVGPAEGPAR